MSLVNESPAWKALEDHHAKMGQATLRALFKSDLGRFDEFSMDAAGLFLDYSKNRINHETIARLITLVNSVGLKQAIADMFSGATINTTEQRSVLHVALRNRSNSPIEVNGKDVMPDVNAVLAQMREFVDSVRSGEWTGFTGEVITDVVNIGIGGSDLGPHMATLALQPYTRDSLRSHFISNVDPAHISDTLAALNPATTLFIVASKTFTTQETMANALTARQWLLDAANDDAVIAKHFVAVSTSQKEVEAFGIDSRQMFAFWDWVGGRYSMWSAVGLSTALAVGMDAFEEMLLGAHEMDEHFRTAPFEENMPVLLALIGIWYVNFFKFETEAILAYDQHLTLLAPYLEQCTMESNGKCVTKSGKYVDYATAPIVWGEPGTNGQHAFYQLLHQGTRIVPVDFLVATQSHSPRGDQHRMLVANVLAQAEAFMLGRTSYEVVDAHPDDDESLIPHKTFPGNRPSNMLIYDKLTPKVLGSLIALYEHKVFVQGVIWGVNTYDQWGVELGKQLAQNIMQDFESDESTQFHDASTQGLVDYCRKKGV